MSDVSGAGAVRSEDAFDVSAVTQWLRHHAADATGIEGEADVVQFTAGASNLTYLLRYPHRDLILRRPPVGTKARGAHDMRREHDIQAALEPRFPLVPHMVALCTDHGVLGSDFYVMDRIVGTILGPTIPAELGLTPERTRELCLTALDTLVSLHTIEPDGTPLASFGKGTGYVRRQVEGWSARYRAARTPDMGDFETIMAWLAERMPDDVRNCLIHNDFRFDNLILDSGDPTRIVGVLDWEMATLGDPLMDLGGALAYWVQADDEAAWRALKQQPTDAPGMLTRAEVVEYYTGRMGLTVSADQWRFYEVFGLFRLAVIAQQIYYRFHAGQTTNPRFGQLAGVVRFLEHRCTMLLTQAG